jgi:hypothetical protein
MRHETAEFRLYPFDEHLIVHWAVSKTAAQGRRGSIRPMTRLATRRSHRVPGLRGRVGECVPDAGAPPRSTVGIEEIREAGSNAHASQY